jgi:cell wall-associated NlpC family hydrolase
MQRLLFSLAIAGLLAVPSPGFAADAVVGSALGYIGTPYRYAGNGTNGFDCAGFVRRAYADAAGIELPRSSAAQYGMGRKIEPEDLTPGDLVFFRDTYKRGISHVGIYVGDGVFVHAASSARRVALDRLDHPYFSRRYAGARRLIEEEPEEPEVCEDEATPAAEPAAPHRTAMTVLP